MRGAASSAEVATPKRPAKAKAPKAPKEVTPEERVAGAAMAAARALVTGGFSEDYRDVRAEVLRAFAMAFAGAYGMKAATLDANLDGMPFGDRQAFVNAVRSLDCSELTPEHYGHVHEKLSGWAIVGGVLTKTPGSTTVHFTPRSLTEGVVRTTLRPILASLAPGASVLELRVCDPAVGAGAFLVEAVRQLAQRLVDDGHEKDMIVAKRLVAVHCLYGTDICPWAIASAKIAMWLECRAECMPVGWLNDNLKVGDALVGLGFGEQLARFHWAPDGKTKKGELIAEDPAFRAVVDRAMETGVAARKARMAALASVARGGV